MATATVAATDLRAELKEWERAFAAANGGRKAERLDIKSNPDIAAKYKAYGKLKGRELASVKGTNPETTLEERPKKRKHSSPTGPGHGQNNTTTTPRKSKSAEGIFATPSQPRTAHPSQLDPYDSPSALHRLFSPRTHQQSSTPLKAAVGPTPQRDGKALGLFDLLSESGGSTATPTANRLASVRGAAVQTPSRRNNKMESIMEENEDEEGQEEDTPRGGRTPASSGKKWYLANLFATPTTLRYAAMVEDEEERRPVVNNQPAAAAAAAAAASPGNKGAAAGQGETPSFLRRSNAGRSFNALDTSTAGLSPIAARKPPQFVGKGLSALVQGLRDMEEERLDDDMDVLRELEADQEAAANQNQDMEGVDVTDGQNQTGRRPYKKKGQKRTTRRVHMKPVVVSKSQTQTQTQTGPAGSDDSYDEELHDDELVAAAVPDTQLPETVNQVPEADDNEHDNNNDNASLHTMSDTEPDDSDPDYDQPVPKTKSFSEKMKEAISADSSSKTTDSQSTEKPDPKTKTKTKPKKQEEEKPRARKVNPNANAHANFRSLKIGRGRGRGGAGRFRGRR